MIPLIGMIACGLGFIGFAAWYFLPQTAEPAAAISTQQDPGYKAVENDTVKEQPGLPIGTLRYVIAKMELVVKSDSKKGAGRIEVELHNDSDRLIRFHAVTAGNINGVAFDFNKVEFDGYIYAHQSGYLVSNRLYDIPLKEQSDLDTPSLLGIYEYDLSYGDARETGFSRRTAKGVRIAIWFPIMGNQKGTTIEKPTRVLLYNEIEE